MTTILLLGSASKTNCGTLILLSKSTWKVETMKVLQCSNCMIAWALRQVTELRLQGIPQSGGGCRVTAQRKSWPTLLEIRQIQWDSSCHWYDTSNGQCSHWGLTSYLLLLLSSTATKWTELQPAIVVSGLTRLTAVVLIELFWLMSMTSA